MNYIIKTSMPSAFIFTIAKRTQSLVLGHTHAQEPKPKKITDDEIYKKSSIAEGKPDFC